MAAAASEATGGAAAAAAFRSRGGPPARREFSIQGTNKMFFSPILFILLPLDICRIY
jgi:hypothetical protein